MAITIYSGSNDGYCFISGADFTVIRDADTSGTVSHNSPELLFILFLLPKKPFLPIGNCTSSNITKISLLIILLK